MNTIKLSQIQFTAAPSADVERGLLGHVNFVLNAGLRIDGVAVRRTLNGRYALSYPARRDRRGRQHPLIQPLGDRVRREIEFAVFKALGIEEAARR